MKKLLYGSVICAILIFLYICPSEGFLASSGGLMLWFQTLVPTLLPLMILSNFIVRAGFVKPFMTLFLPLFRFLFGVSANGSYAICVGFFCGYPMGAKVISDLIKERQISVTEGQFLLGFCNNVSPVFLINFLVVQHLKRNDLILPTLCIIYGASLLYGMLISIPKRKTFQNFSEKNDTKTASTSVLNFELVDACIMDGISNITKLGGYIILFALLAKILQYLPILKAVPKATLVGIMEVTNGIHALCITQTSFPVQYLLLIMICSFGGLCSIAQTVSMIHGTGLCLSKYVLSKAAVTALSLLGALCFLF